MIELDFWSMLFVFMLATFIGFEVIRNVSRLLHTPLMSLTNAISAIAVVGSIKCIGNEAARQLAVEAGAFEDRVVKICHGRRSGRRRWETRLAPGLTDSR